MLRLVFILFGLLPLSVHADISFIVTNAEDAIGAAQSGSLSVGAIIVSVVGGLFLVNLILRILKGA